MENIQKLKTEDSDPQREHRNLTSRKKSNMWVKYENISEEKVFGKKTHRRPTKDTETIRCKIRHKTQGKK